MEYSYNKVVSGGKLHIQLDETFPDFTGITSNSDNNVLIIFNNPLSATDKANLDNIMISHDAALKNYQIYEYFSGSKDSTKFPGRINYKSELDKRLHPKRILGGGLLTNIKYYGECVFDVGGELAFSDPVINVDFVWFLDEYGNIVKRVSEIRYYYDDGALDSEAKTLEKLYNPIEAFNASRRKRKNILDEVELSAYGMIIATEPKLTTDEVKRLCSEWLEKHSGGLSSFLETGSAQLAEAILDDAAYWLRNEVQPGLSIKTYIIGKLS